MRIKNEYLLVLKYNDSQKQPNYKYYIWTYLNIYLINFYSHFYYLLFSHIFAIILIIHRVILITTIIQPQISVFHVSIHVPFVIPKNHKICVPAKLASIYRPIIIAAYLVSLIAKSVLPT